LANPNDYYNELIVREFYADVCPLIRHFDNGGFSWMIGTSVNYDRNTITRYHHINLEMPDGKREKFETMMR